MKENITGFKLFLQCFCRFQEYFVFLQVLLIFLTSYFENYEKKDISKTCKPVNMSVNRLHLDSCLHSPTLILLQNCRIRLNQPSVSSFGRIFPLQSREVQNLFSDLCYKFCNTRNTKVEDLGAPTTGTALRFRSSSKHTFQLA